MERKNKYLGIFLALKFLGVMLLLCLIQFIVFTGMDIITSKNDRDAQVVVQETVYPIYMQVDELDSVAFHVSIDGSLECITVDKRIVKEVTNSEVQEPMVYIYKLDNKIINVITVKRERAK